MKTYFLKLERILNSQDFRLVFPNISWLLVEKLLRIPLGLFVIAAIARYLGPEDYGRLNLALALASVFAAAERLGLGQPATQELVENKDEHGALVGTTLGLQVAGGIIAASLATATSFITYFERGQLITLLVLLISIGGIFRSSTAFRYWLEANNLARFAAAAEGLAFLISSAGKLILVYFAAPLFTFALFSAIEAMICAAIMTLTYKKHVKGEGALVFHRGTALRLLSRSWPLLLTSVLVIFYMRIDQIMLGILRTPKDVGLYAAAVRISEFFFFIPTAVIAAIYPTLLKKRVSDRDYYNRQLQRIFTFLTWLSIAFALLVSLTSNITIPLIFGETYQASSVVLIILSWNAVFVTIRLASGPWLVAEGLERLSLARAMAAAAMNICLNLLLIPPFGIIGAAISTLISSSIAALWIDLAHPRTRSIFAVKFRAFLFKFPH